MNIPFYTSTREYEQHKDKFNSAVASVMAKGDFILGSEVTEFEKETARYLNVKYSIGVASGSDALILGADILGLSNGAEVLTPTFTFFASSSCIARQKGIPVFVDMDPDTFEMDLNDAERKITKKTKGIVPVHLFNQTTPMQKVKSIAKAHNLKILEDSAEAWGMESYVDGKWQKAGTIGDIGIYSFFPTKTLGAYGDAGLMVTNDEELYQKIRSYRVHGSTIKYHHDYVGYNSRLDTIQAAILRVKMTNINEAIEKRSSHANHYTALLKDIEQIRFPQIHKESKPVQYVYNILVPNRDELVDFLKENGIGTSVYYPIPLHLQKCFSYLGYKKGDFPVAEKISGEILALPMYPELKSEEIDYICEKIKIFFMKR